MPRVAGRGYFDDGFRRFDVDCQHGDFYTPDRVKKCVVFFVDWVPTEKGGERKVRTQFVCCGGETYTTQSPFQKRGSAGREPSLLDLFR